MKKKSPFKSKTIWFSFAIMVLGLIQGFVAQIKIDPLQQMMILFAIASIGMYLRFKTGLPLL